MALDASNVLVGYTGEVYFAAVNLITPVVLPTNATTALPADFDGLGYNTEDGVSETPTEQWTDIRAWQRGAVVRKIRTQEDWVWEFAMLETNPMALEVYYGNYAAGGVLIGGQNATRGHWVIEVLDGDDVLRIVIPDGEITGRGAHSYQTDEGIAYPVTLTAYPSNHAVTDGANAIVYRGVVA